MKDHKCSVNEKIRTPRVRLIGVDRKVIGEDVPIRDALSASMQQGLDLVELVPGVCRIMDYGKYQFEQQKQQKRKKSKRVQLKEIQLRTVIDTNDYNVKLRKALDFLHEGHKVKFVVRHRGRGDLQALGIGLLERIKSDLAAHSSVEQMPKYEGRLYHMVLMPLGTKGRQQQAQLDS